MSIVQGGSGFPVLLPAAYHYLTTGEYLGQFVDDGSIPDPEIRQLLHQVRNDGPQQYSNFFGLIHATPRFQLVLGGRGGWLSPCN